MKATFTDFLVNTPPMKKLTLTNLYTHLKIYNFWIKLLIFILLSYVILKFDPKLETTLYYISLITTKYLTITYLLCNLFIMCNLLYLTSMLFLINKYSALYEKPIFSKYLPTFIQNELLGLYEISQFDLNSKQIILNNILTTLLALIVLIMIHLCFILVLCILFI